MTDKQPLSPSRRSLMKGAAWAVPAVAVATATPAMAASPVKIPCPSADALGFRYQNADVLSLTRAVGTSDSKGVPGRKGSFFDMRLGTWQTPNRVFADANGNPVKVSGYRMRFKPATIRSVAKVASGGAKFKSPAKWTMGPKDAAGNDTWQGNLTWENNPLPLAIGAGLVFTASMQTDMPYLGGIVAGRPDREAYKTLMMSFPVEITLLDFLDPAITYTTDCNYHINFIYHSGLGTTYSISGTTAGKHAWAGLNPRDAWMSDGLPELPAYTG